MAARKGRGKQAVRSGGWPAWAFVLVGLVAGALAMYVIMRHGYMPISRQANLPTANPHARPPRGSEPGVADQTTKGGKSKKPSYDFYSVLPEKEVVIPDSEISKQAKAESSARSGSGNATAGQTAKATPSAGSDYLLQVGSFPKASDAEAMKAKLALQGFVASVQSVTINGRTWHRVRLGPFGSASKLESVKNRLSSAGFHAIALKENH